MKHKMTLLSIYNTSRNLLSPLPHPKKNLKKLKKTIRSYLVPLNLKTQTRTHKRFPSLADRCNMRPISQNNIGRKLSSRKKPEENVIMNNLNYNYIKI